MMMSNNNDNLAISQSDELEIERMEEGLIFETDEVAVGAVEAWASKSFCPLIKVRFHKGHFKNGEYEKGRRCFKCPHGVQRKSKATGSRPSQRLKFTQCPVKINLNERDDGSWMVTSCNLEHQGHPITQENFLSHQQARKLSEDDKECIKGLVRAKTNVRNIADVLSERTGMNLAVQTVRNIINQLKESDKEVKTVEMVLGEIRDQGVDVRYRKERETNNVDVLWLQTKDMKEMINRCKPLVFECDTTFGTQAEGYKLFIPLFHSNITDKWEIGGLLFLSTETKEKVQAGIEFFKSSLPYSTEGGASKFIFFTDKDFDYIEVSMKQKLQYRFF